MQFEYKPQDIEKLFQKDWVSKRVHQLAMQKQIKLETADITEVIGFLDEEKTLALIKIN